MHYSVLPGVCEAQDWLRSGCNVLSVLPRGLCIHAGNPPTHDTQVPVYLAAKYRRNGVYKDARTILAIHNLSHQGVDPAETFANLGLPDDMWVRQPLDATEGLVEASVEGRRPSCCGLHMQGLNQFGRT